ncbi:hypothetical protein N5F23_04970 [Pseudomonas sichuanensis]|uniref:hypothetical protein n=1 Tax=Pseudomonas sichuanensis TaxID=2213015 RepID=UPI0024494A3E|nr:hypothetical protein [Pseudomonas sichuanensis]MDH0732929.1 hypothetical protein [Pseudomonas sichuanensis]MDH1581941.1 hypothetical protein [Pseudomonas sichuanensis]MDH1591381.1 hypothetical protein [Pseudomonas sichuanensis]MDH1597021.1 hypothetical protein [Pseudomonas sichuanensis]
MAPVQKKKLSDAALEYLESQIPKMAAAATRLAYYRAVAAGHTVVTVEQDRIVATHADGQVEVLVESRPRRKVQKGQVLTVRKIDGRT